LKRLLVRRFSGRPQKVRVESLNTEVKQEVRQFYDEIGWKLVGEELYQNAHYEDLRPVSRSYIQKCHRRVLSHLRQQGRFLLDAGSGPVQYPEYLEYSRGYEYRVCADISITALKEARRRIGDHGLYVVVDVATLPFKSDVFDGVVSLHTIHHLPEEEHLLAYQGLHRVLAPDASAVIVNGWANSRLMDAADPLIKAANKIRYYYYRFGKKEFNLNEGFRPNEERSKKKSRTDDSPIGTFTNKHDADWIRSELGKFMPVEILVWRSVTVRFMRALIHSYSGGRFWLRLIYSLEERFPGYFGENGKYPLIIIRKSSEVKK
jgi:ubiquinone/menaquinone biosynthesis C-methylase UbiE